MNQLLSLPGVLESTPMDDFLNLSAHLMWEVKRYQEQLLREEQMATALLVGMPLDAWEIGFVEDHVAQVPGTAYLGQQHTRDSTRRPRRAVVPLVE